MIQLASMTGAWGDTAVGALMRRLAYAKLAELRAQGLTDGEIAARFAALEQHGEESDSDPAADSSLTDAALRDRFGLTPAEARVARLLAEGRRNDDVARLLFISPHTARRHTERILHKMHVHSRAEVTHLLMRAAPV